MGALGDNIHPCYVPNRCRWGFLFVCVTVSSLTRAVKLKGNFRVFCIQCTQNQRYTLLNYELAVPKQIFGGIQEEGV